MSDTENVNVAKEEDSAPAPAKTKEECEKEYNQLVAFIGDKTFKLRILEAEIDQLINKVAKVIQDNKKANEPKPNRAERRAQESEAARA